MGLVALCAAGAAFAGFWATGASAQTTIALRVTTAPSPVATDVVDFAGQTYAAAKAAVKAREVAAPATATVKVAFTGLTDLVSADALLRTDDGTFGISLQGSTTLLGKPGHLLVTASWTNSSTDTAPKVAVLVRFDNVGLDTLNPSWQSTAVTFGPAIVAVTDADHDLVPNTALGTDTFLADGLADTSDTMALKAAGVNFEGVIGSGALVDGAKEIGSTATAVRLRGTLAASVKVLDGGAPDPSVDAGLDLAVDIPVATPASFPSWVSLSSPWTLAIKADTGNNFSASFTGGASVKPDGQNPVDVTGTASVEVAGGATTLGLQLGIGPINDLFGQSWLDLSGATVNATLTKTAFSGSITGGLTVGPLSGEASLALTVAQGGDISASLDIATTVPVKASDLVAAIGGTPSAIDPGLVDLTLNAVKFHVAVERPKGGTASLTASLFGDASLTIGQGSFNAQMLFRVTGDTAQHQILVAGKLTTPTLKQLDPSIPFDWKLPDLAIIASTADFASPYADLDPPTAAFFASTLCDAQGANCGDLDVTQGLEIKALAELDPALTKELKTLGITVTGPVDITGTLPIFGGSKVALKVALPTIVGPADGLVKQGTVSFAIAFDTTTRSVKASIDGNMVFRITRPGACDGTESGTWPNGQGCYDELNLTVSAGVSVGIGGVEISLAAQIDEWNHAFGLDWLKINTFRVQLGIKAGGGTTASLNIGILGRIQFGVAPQTKDLTLAIKVGITPNPPWIDLEGFTLASGDGIGLREVARMFDPNISDAAINAVPDLSLKNLWVAYGTATDEALCIRQGLFISAELHLGAPTSSNATPGCIPQRTLPATPDQLPTASCESQNTCLAAVLIDVQTGADPSLTAAGFIRSFDAGPIHIGTTKLDLELSITKQRLFVQGSATITDVTGATQDVWAAGALTIDFRNDNGAVSLFVDGLVNIGGSDGLTSHLTGSISADFSKLGSLRLVEFLNSLHFDLKYELTFPALQKFGDQVNQGFVPVKAWIDTTGTDIQGAFDPNSNQDLASLVHFFQPVSTAPEFGYLQGYSGGLGTTATDIQNQTTADYNYVLGYWQLRFYDVLLPNGTRVNAQDYYLDKINTGSQAAVQARGLGEITLHGIDVVLLPATDVGLEHIKELRLTVAGRCQPGGTLAGNPICTGGVTSVTSSAIAPLTGALFTNDTGYTLATSVVAPRSAAALAATPRRFALAAAALSPPADAFDAINRLSNAFTTNSTSVTCATVVVHYDTKTGNKQDPATITLDAFGTRTSIQGNVNVRNPSQPIAAIATVQTSLNTILDAQTPAVPCQEPAQPVGPGGTTITVNQSSINEGGTVTVSGKADTRFRGTQINLTWGDATTSSTLANATDGTWSASHTYPDDPGAGGSTRFLISASAAGTPDTNFTRVTVNNVAPTLVGVAVTPAVNEGSKATVTGRFTDPGALDDQTLLVTWGDGTSSTVTFAAGAAKSFALDHLYPDDNPTLTASDPMRVSLLLTDKDGGRATAQSIVTVKNLTPTNVKLDAVTVGGTPVKRDTAGHAEVTEGASASYTGSFRDLGIQDTDTLSIDWGDGTRGSAAIVQRDAIDPTLLRFNAIHTYIDDNPTGTASDLYTVTLFAGDDDQGVTTATDQVRVTDIAPVVAPAAVASTTENVGISLAATFTDVGVNDTHTALVDWGDKTTPQAVPVTQAAGKGSIAATHTYGDNGTYTIAVSVTDDDTLTGSATTTVRVDNTVPVVVIDRSTTVVFHGVPTVVGIQGQPVASTGTITDPGSDDIAYTWAFGDGLTATVTNRVNPPNADPALSPTIQPRSFRVPVSHTYARPCAYRSTLSGVDDDGGAATPDTVDVVVVASTHRWGSNGFWKNEYRAKGSISAADLACYLKVISHLSQVFGAPDPVNLATSADATAVLDKVGTTGDLDRELLVAWLNAANGGVALTTPFDFNRDGVPDLTVAQVLASAETVRLNPTSTKKQLDSARQDVQAIARFGK